MTDAELDALAARLNEYEWGDPATHLIVESRDAIAALRQERDHATVRADTNYASYKMASEERDAAYTKVNALKEQLRQANGVRDVFAQALVVAVEQDESLRRKKK